MKAPQKRLELIKCLVACLLRNPAGMKEDVAKSACRLDNEITPIVMLQALAQAQMFVHHKIFELQAPHCIAQRAEWLAKLDVLQNYVAQLYALEAVNTDEIGSEPFCDPITLSNESKAIIRPLTLPDFPGVFRLMSAMEAQDKSTLRFTGSHSVMTTLFEWYNRLPSNFPVPIVQLENGEIAAIGTAFPEHGLLSNAATVAIGVDGNRRGLGVREALLKKIVALAPPYFRTLISHSLASQESELKTYRRLGFAEQNVGICLPNGEGEREPWIFLTLDLGTDEEYTAACD